MIIFIEVNPINTKFKNKTKPNKELYRINEKIKSNTLRLIGQDGKNLGLYKKDEALIYANKYNLDLVVIQSNTTPIVCQIMDFYKYLYKKNKLKKNNNINTTIKEVKIRPTIDKADYDIKFKNILKFINKHIKVKISIRVRSREKVYKELCINILNNIQKDIKNLGRMVLCIQKLEDKNLYLLLYPKL